MCTVKSATSLKSKQEFKNLHKIGYRYFNKDKFSKTDKLIIKSFMTKNPISVDKDTLAAKAVGIMNERKITSLCVHSKSNRKKTIGIIHIHNLISADIS